MTPVFLWSIPLAASSEFLYVLRPARSREDCFTARMLFLCGILLLISDAALAAVVRAREGSLVWALVDGRRMMTRKVTDQGRGRR